MGGKIGGEHVAANQQLFQFSDNQSQGSTCSFPTGETSYYSGWGADNYNLAGDFYMSIQGAGNYSGMTIQENWSNFQNLCTYPGTPYPMTAPANGPPWYVFNNQYSTDHIGMANDQTDLIRWYQGRGQSCGWQGIQTMTISGGGAWGVYDSHWGGFQLWPTAIGAYRSTAEGWISWQ